MMEEKTIKEVRDYLGIKECDKCGTRTYVLIMYMIHSALESYKRELIITEDTTVENFDEAPENKKITDMIFKTTLESYNYEISHNQMCNGINLLLGNHRNEQA
jgi:hypothetical protein